MFDPVEFGKAMAGIVKEAMAPLLKRVEELEARQPLKGDKGDKGDAGKDADPVDTEAVVRDLLSSDDLLSLVELRVREAVAEIPTPKDGKDGAPGPQGERGEKGESGKDGAGIQDLLIDRDGNLVATMTDGRTKSLGRVVGKDGERGKDGKDGADFTEVRFEYDGERALKVIGKGGELVCRLPIPIDRGYWKKGAFEQADIVTEGGTAYIALKDTSEKPSPSSADWRILARKGRDGVDGRNGIDKTAPVKL